MIERAEVMMENENRRSRRSYGDDDKYSPDAIATSVADAVQRGLDSENLRILGTALIPMGILPSIARVSEADYGKFMGMVKEDIVSRIDGGCGIDVILATSGRRRRVVFWKVQPKARLGIFLPSYEA